MAHTLAGFAGRRRREGGVNSLQEHPAPEAAAVWVTRPMPSAGGCGSAPDSQAGVLLRIKGNTLAPPHPSLRSSAAERVMQLRGMLQKARSQKRSAGLSARREKGLR